MKKTTFKERKIRKYLLTSIGFLAGVAIVFAVINLATAGKRVNWLSRNNGLARDKVLPYVFTEGDELYVLNESMACVPVDNNVSDSVYDAEFDRIYYLSEGVLYEYNVSNNFRKKLCEGLSAFDLFAERKFIECENENADVMLYSYNSGKLTTLRKGNSENFNPATIGQNLVVYFNDGKLCGTVPGGKTYVISDKALHTKGVAIWKKDRAVSYYTADGLEIWNTETKKTEKFPLGFVVEPNDMSYSEISDDFAGTFDECKNYSYVMTDVKEDFSTGTLKYVKVTSRGIKVGNVFENVCKIIAFDEYEDVIIFAVRKDDNMFDIYRSQKGKAPKLILTANDSTEFLYENLSQSLYYKDGNGSVSFVKVNDKRLKTYHVADKIESMYRYFGKPFAVLYGASGDNKTISLGMNKFEDYSSREVRLYGKKDDTYLMYRQDDESQFVSLDIVRNGKIERISNSCSKNCIFDNKIENVIYWSNGKLYIYSEGSSKEIGEFKQEVYRVDVEVKN